MNRFESAKDTLSSSPTTWGVTGCAGFIGSHLVEQLLQLNQIVVGLDNFSTGHPSNLHAIRDSVGPEKWANFVFLEGDIRELDACMSLCGNSEYVLHQAALGSVPRSLVDPVATNSVNVSGFLNMLVAARDSHVKKFVYAASSSTYGDHPELPKVEERIGNPLSPYAVTKYVNELYAQVFDRSYGLKSIGLRYFNVFGPRQDPNGAYAAVIPKWFSTMLMQESIVINGDGSTSRDFCYIENVVQANILAALAMDIERSEVLNIAYGEKNSLLNLFEIIKLNLESLGLNYNLLPIYGEFRPGDVRHSLADITKARRLIGYQPQISLRAGITKARNWYAAQRK